MSEAMWRSPVRVTATRKVWISPSHWPNVDDTQSDNYELLYRLPTV